MAVAVSTAPTMRRPTRELGSGPGPMNPWWLRKTGKETGSRGVRRGDGGQLGPADVTPSDSEKEDLEKCSIRPRFESRRN
jgi:hypothetical protein